MLSPSFLSWKNYNWITALRVQINEYALTLTIFRLYFVRIIKSFQDHLLAFAPFVLSSPTIALPPVASTTEISRLSASKLTLDFEELRRGYVSTRVWKITARKTTGLSCLWYFVTFWENSQSPTPTYHDTTPASNIWFDHFENYALQNCRFSGTSFRNLAKQESGALNVLNEVDCREAVNRRNEG